MFTGWCFALGVIIVITLKYDAVMSSPLKIVNGTNAQEGDAPYIVQIRDKLGVFCDGSIIAPDWILTAAHCLKEDFDNASLEIVYGTLKLQNKGLPENAVSVKQGMMHPKFDYDAQIYDVALLQLEKPIPLSDKVRAVKLPCSNDVPFHVDGLLTGWGSGSEEGPSIVDLQKLTVPLLSDEQCLKALNSETLGNLFNPTHQLCTDDHNNGQCYGDSGGPYVINGVQYGVVSWGHDPCASHPGVYSRVSSPEQLQWIKETSKVK